MSASTDAARASLSAAVPVVEVVVMEDRARVVRRGEVALASGLSRLRMEPVAPVASDKTLVGRIAAGPTGARIVASRIVREQRTVEELPPEDPEAVRAKLGDLNRQFRREGATESLLTSEINALDQAAEYAVRDLADDVAWSRAEFGVWKGRLASIDTKRRTALEALNAVRDAMDRMRKEIARLEAVASASGGTTTLTVVAIECDVEVETAGTYTLQFEYTVPGACWRPYHTAELGDGTVTFLAEGCVWQNTGEDWNDATLVFSTERPSLGSEPPRLGSDLVALAPKQEQVVVEARDQTVQTSGLGRTAKTSPKLPGVDDGGEVRVMRAAHPATVPSDGRPCRVEILRFVSEAEVSHVSMPELAACVILQSVQTNHASFPLLAGPVDLIRKSGLVGRSTIKFVAPGERFALGWGPDNEIRVHRETDRTEDEGGMLSSWITSARSVRVRLSNIGDSPRRVRLTERIPVSEIDAVAIEFDRAATTPGPTPDGDGMLVWDVELKPFGRDAVKLGYTVRKKKGVVGV